MPGVYPDVGVSTNAERLDRHLELNDLELSELDTNSISVIPDQEASHSQHSAGLVPIMGIIVVIAILSLSVYFAVRYLF